MNQEIAKHEAEIEALKASMAELREDRSFREAVIQSAAEGICVCHEIETDPFIRFTVWNDRMIEITGYTMEQINRLGWYQTVYPDEAVRTLAAERMSRMRVGDDLRDEEWEITRADGEKRLIGISTTILETSDGGVHVLALMHDLTEHKRVERRLKREKEKFKVLVEGSPLGVSLIEASGRYAYINPKFIDIFGYTLEDVPTGKAWFEKAFPNPDLRREVVSSWKTGFGSPQAGESLHRIHPVRCKDGSEKVIHFRAVIMDTGDQFVLYEDISEQKRLEMQFQQAQKMEAVGTLAGGVAHDFNNLLTSILGNAELMSMSIEKGNPLSQYIDKIRKAGQSAASLTRQLLAFSRKQLIQPEVLDLNEVIEGTEKMLGRLIGEDIAFYTALSPDLWKCEADPGQMEQVIMNLAVNARDAMPRGGRLMVETANVNLSGEYMTDHGLSESAGPFVMVAVSDTGVGMDKATRNRVFEPFFTTKKKGKGTGLGLSTVYGIIKQARGYVWVYSEVGKGTTFKVYLPRFDASAAPVENDEAFRELGGEETLLVVEDDDKVRSLVRIVMERYGYRVISATSGEEAVALSRDYQGPIHLMITDVIMPGISGKDLAERLSETRSEMKVLYMSGYTDEAIIQHGVLEEGVDFIQKPFEPRGLALKVRNVLDH